MQEAACFSAFFLLSRRPLMSTPNRSVRKRTKPVREEQLLQIAGMHLEHRSQRDIAAKLGLSQSQVSRDLKEIKRRRQSSHQQDLAALQAAQHFPR